LPGKRLSATLERMARGLNKVMLIGNLGRDAETRHTPSGVAVTNFSIATARRIKDQSGEWRDETDWHDIVLWRGENVAPYLLKGTQVYVEGRLQTRSWDDQAGQKKYRTEVVVDGNMGLMLLSGGGGSGGGRGEGGGGGRPSGGGGGRSSGPADDDLAISDDDVPF
jgi:single-strand DNA-binding protein